MSVAASGGGGHGKRGKKGNKRRIEKVVTSIAIFYVPIGNAQLNRIDEFVGFAIVYIIDACFFFFSGSSQTPAMRFRNEERKGT